MTFDEWYDTKESVKLIPPELRDMWKQGVKMVWDAAVEEIKRKCLEAVCHAECACIPGHLLACSFHCALDQCDFYRAIIEVDI